MSEEERSGLRKQFEEKGLIRPGEFAEHVFGGAPDPLLLTIRSLKAADWTRLLPLFQLHRRRHRLPVTQDLDLDHISDFAAA
jgi:hypothetical protein